MDREKEKTAIYTFITDKNKNKRAPFFFLRTQVRRVWSIQEKAEKNFIQIKVKVTKKD